MVMLALGLLSLLVADLVVAVASGFPSSSIGYKLMPLKHLGILGPFQISTNLPHYSHYGAVDVTEGSILFGRKQKYLSGAIWSKNRMPFGEWQLTAKVRIRGEPAREGGDGMAFWYTKEGHAPGIVLGGPDKWTGLGVLIDTFDDDKKGNNPAIMGIMNNGTMEYAKALDGEGQYMSGCLRNVRNLSQPLYLRITYMRGALKVELDDSRDGKDYVNCFEKSGIILPAGYYFGISGATNGDPDSYELLEMNINGAEAIVESTDGSEAHPEAHPLPNAQHAGQASPPMAGAVGASGHVDHASLLQAIEAIVQKQLRTFMPSIIAGHSEETLRKASQERLNSLDERLKQQSDVLGQLHRVLTGLMDHVAHLDTTHLSEDLHHLGEDLKNRVDTLRGVTTQMQAQHADLHMSIKQGHGSWWKHYKGYILFLALQVTMLFAYLTIKNRLDRREKKWM